MGQVKSVSFETTLRSFGNNTGIVVPAEKIAELGAGQRPAVVVTVNGYEYRNTVGVMGGQHLVSVSAAIRQQTGLTSGDAITVVLTLADTPRSVDIPPDFAAALQHSPEAKRFFDGLSNSLQRFHADNVAAAKTDETRSRRIDKAIQLFLAGKQR